MALTESLAGQLESAYKTGDTGAVNSLLQANQISAGDVQSFWGFSPEQVASTGLNFYSPPAGGALSSATNLANTAAANTGAQAGLTQAAAQPDYGQLVQSAYGGIGRTGFGTGTAQIDQPGYDYWLNQLKTGTLTPDTFRTTFNTAVQDYISKNPTDVYSTQALGTMVGSLLNPATNLTEAQRTAGVLGLQNKFGLTDADIAKYSSGKVNPLDVSTYLAPIKTFQNTYQTIMSDPSSKASDIVNFVNSSLEDKKISGLFGTTLNKLKDSDQFKEIQRLADVGTVKDYQGNEYNPLTLLKLAGQIGKNLDTTKLSGGAFETKGEGIGFDYGEAAKVFGKDPNAAQQVLLDMARYLIKSGVTDLGQLYSKEYTTADQIVGGEGSDQVIPGYATRGVFAGDKLIDGQFGQTYTGKGGTGYNVTIDPTTGHPKFSATGFDTSDAGTIAPLLAFGSMLVAPWLAGQIGSLLPGAAITGTAAAEAGALGLIPGTTANTIASQALAGGLLSGTSAALQDKDFGTGFLRGALPSVVSYGLGQAIPSEFTAANPQLSNAIRGIGTNVITAGLTGQDMSDALTNGVINNTLSAALNMIPGYSALPAAGKTLVSTAVSNAVRNRQFDPFSTALAMISSQMAADRRATPKAQGGLAMASGGAVKGYDDGGYVTSDSYSYTPSFDASNFDIGSIDIPAFTQIDLPTAIQIASASSDIADLLRPTYDVTGVPIFADSIRADTVPLGWNERLLSMEEVSNTALPPGSGYDPARNAWITKSDALVDLENIAAQGFGYGTMLGTGETGDFSRMDRDLYNAGLDQNVIDTLMNVPSRDFGAYTGTNIPSDADFTQQLINDMAGDLGLVNVTGQRESLVEDDLQSIIDYGPGREDIVPDAGVSVDLPTGLIVPTELDNETIDAVLNPVTITAARENDGVSTDLSTGLTTPTDEDEDRRLDCAEGYHEENGICVADDDTKKPPVECPDGYIYNFNTQSCEKVDDTKGCPPGYVYNPATKQCEKVTKTPPPPPPAQRTGASIPGPAAINIPPVQQLAPLVLQALRTEGGGGKYQDPLERLKEAVAGTRGSAVEAYKMDPYLESILRQRQDPGYYNYGREPSLEEILSRRQMAAGGAVPAYAHGGLASPLMAAAGGKSYVDGREDFRDGKHVAGPGDGQSDDIPAMLADGEFVFPADVVAALGNGSTKAGTDKLYEMMHNIRSYHRSAKPKDLPPPAKKSPLDYLSGKKQGAKK